LLVARTQDGGQSWSRVEKTEISNPSAPVAALPLGGGTVLMVANDAPDGGDRLSLLLSHDEGETWQGLKVLEETGAGARYPMMTVTDEGQILLTYSTGNKRGVRLFAFNAAWVWAQ
jgi:photosystem II stability/assembly factor-like uncharacterized protein